MHSSYSMTEDLYRNKEATPSIFHNKGFDLKLSLLPLILSIVGLVMVYSASGRVAIRNHLPTTYFFINQAKFLCIGIMVMVIFRYIDYHLLLKYKWWLLSSVILLLILVLFFKGDNKRWIRIAGHSFQVSELARPVLIIFLASLLGKNPLQVKELKNMYLPALIFISLVSFLIWIEPDYGVACFTFFIGILMLFIAGARIIHLIGTILPPALLVVIKIWHDPRHLAKIKGVFDPYSTSLKEGFQIMQSFIAMGSGGLFGRGLGHSAQKAYLLPHPHTDFILSIIGEELGFVGFFMVISLYAILIYHGFSIAKKARDLEGSLLATGLTLCIGLQVLLHAGVCLGWMFPEGITLPFISYGGSSLVVSFFIIGILQNISLSSRKRSL